MEFVCVCVCVCVCFLGRGSFGEGGGLVSLDYVVGSMLVVLMSFSLVKPSYIVSQKRNVSRVAIGLYLGYTMFEE